MRSNYVWHPLTEELNFDAQLIEHVVNNLKYGKAAGLDNLTAEHLQHCHPLLPGVLAKLFNYFIRQGYVPEQFGKSYTVPLRKVNSTANHVTVDDFRGISISSVLSKVFEHCVISRYGKFLETNDNQF